MAEEAAPVINEPVNVQPEMDIMTAVREVLKNALHHEGLQRGLRLAVKALDRNVAQICFLAEDCDESSYTRLIEALCQERQVPLIKIPEGKTLGEWCGLCKIDSEGKPRKVLRCSSAVITDFGEDTPALGVVLKYVQAKQ
ncbi:uncharacterized protein [Blastocystis hominis]|uniref:40S ribosomal protein S12 n=1 Tax=Blastocystis hominis TaxID=12968 RepID=D8LZG2_BLAHO|nr:uncharacterized protein [Blastocystis hominis]CBK21201.2 unnamed protein product [Blastocystis hominis]|eukprot:XP_012895249.1 uncharacterized protein [Blastocystis hominis]